MTTKIATILKIEEEIEMTEEMATEITTDDIETMIDVVTITAIITIEQDIGKESSIKIL